jgi:membrane protein
VLRLVWRGFVGLPGVRWVWRFIADIYDEWNHDRCGGLAAEIAFWLVLSIFPGLLVLGAMLGWLDTVLGADVAVRAETEIVEGVDSALGSEAGPISSAIAELFATPSAQALTVGVLLSLFGFARGFNAVVGALDIAYDIQAQRSWFHTRVTAVLLGFGTLVIGALAMTVLFLGPLFGRSGELGTWFTSTWQTVGPFAMFVALVVWAATIYHITPLHVTPWRWDLPGAVVAAFFWLAATLGFRIYIDSTIGGSNAILGAVGAMLSLLLWVYVLSIGLLIGAEVNDVLAKRAGVALVHLEKRTVRNAAKDAAARFTGRRRRHKPVPRDRPGDRRVT